MVVHRTAMLWPLFEGLSISNSQRKVIETHSALVKLVAGGFVMYQKGEIDIAWVVQVPDTKSRLLGANRQPETQPSVHQRTLLSPSVTVRSM
jgi:hypothetical protein